MAKSLRLLVVVCVSLLFLYWRTSAILRPGAPAESFGISEGDRVCLPEFEGASERSDVFVVATDALCPFCEEAKPFQAQLEEFGNGAGIRTMYLISDAPEGEPLAERYQASRKLVIRARASQVGVYILPTFLRVSSQGIVKAIWIGAFPTESAKQLAWTLLTQNKQSPLGNATAADLSAPPEHAVIVGFSRRVLASYPSAKYFDEKDFVVRAENELDKRQRVIIDCRSGQSVGGCQYLARALVQKGFPDVKTVGTHSQRSVCPGDR